MKTVVIWIALCISYAQNALAQDVPFLCHVPGFEKGKHYTYKYQMRIATGITQGNVKQFSAFAARFKMAVENHDGKLRIQYHDFEVGQFNDKIHNIFDELPITYVKLTDRNLEVAEALKTPFVASVENGMIKYFEFSENERGEVTNVKKAIALLLQLNLRPPEHKDQHYYTVDEDGIGGDCPTAYSIIDDPPEDAAHIQMLNVTKERLYAKCKKRPHLFHINIQGSKQLDSQFEPLQELAQSEYQIRGNREKYTIENVVSNGAVVLTPFTTNGQSILSLVNQSLTLVDVEDGLVLMDMPENRIADQRFSFRFESDARDHDKVDLKEAHLDRLVNTINLHDRSDELVALLSELVKSFDEHKNGARLVGKVVSCLRTLDYDGMLNFYDTHVHGAQNEQAAKTIRGVFNEVLPYVGSNPSILFLFHLIETEKVEVRVASGWLQKIPFNVKEPSQRLLAKYKKLLENEPITKYTNLFNSGWLSYGSLISKACEQSEFNPHPLNAPHYIKNEVCDQLVNELVEKFNNAKTQTEQSVYLRAIKNTHLSAPGSVKFKFLLNIARNEYPLLLRLESLPSLSNFREIEHLKEEVTAVMVQILRNTHAHYMLRAYAFDILLGVNISPQQFGLLLQNLQKEPCQKIASHIYSTLAAIANGTYECADTMAMRARFLLQFIEKPKSDVMQHSFLRSFTSYNGKYKFGRNNLLTVIPSNTSAVPTTAYLEQYINVMGYEFQLAEFVYLSEGNNMFEQLLYVALQPKGLTPGQQSSPPEYLKHVIDDLKLQDAIKEEIKDYEVYVRLFNRDIFYTRAFGFEDTSLFGGQSPVPSTGYTIAALLRQRSDITRDEQTAILKVNNIAYVDGRLVVPSEVGLPVYIELRVPATYQVSAYAEVVPLFVSTDHQVSPSKRIRSINAKFDIELTSDINVEFVMYVENLGGKRFGYSLDTRVGLKLPVIGDVGYDFKSKKLDIKYIPRTKGFDLIDYETRPATFDHKNVKDVHFADKPVNKQYSTGHHYFGIGLKLNVTSDHLPNDYGKFFKSFSTRQCVNEDYQYLTDKVYAGVRGFLDYLLLNPTAKPVKLNVRYGRCNTHPATEFSITSTCTSAYDSVDDEVMKNKKWVLDVVGKGAVDRTWKIEYFTDSHYPYNDKRNSSFRFRRSSAPGWFDQPFEMCYNGDLEFENYKSLFTPTPKDPVVKYNGHFLFGDKCSLENPNFVIKSIWGKSEEHELVDASQTAYSKQCVQDFKVGFYSEACWERIKDLGRITNFTFEIEHTNIPIEVKRYLYKIRRFVRHYFYSNLQIEPFEGTAEENRVKIIANVSYHDPIVDVNVFHPYETTHYHNIYIPSIFPKYEPYTIAEPTSDRLARMLFNYNPPFCFASGRHVFTLDGVHYQRKLGDCYYLLFADCLHHTINILLKDVQHNKFSKALRVFLGHTLIDVVPGDDDELVVKVNDQVKSGGIYQHVSEDTDESLFIVSRYSPGIYIEAKSYSVKIYFDGSVAFIQASNFYRGRHCGLCGNFDGEKSVEYVGPTGELHKNAMDFAKSYAVRRDECTVE